MNKQLLKFFLGFCFLLARAPAYGTELTEAIRDGHYDKVEELIESGASVNAVGNPAMPSALAMAVDKNKARLAEHFIQHGADVNALHPVSQCSLLQTAAALPVSGSRLGLVRVLVENGAKVDFSTANCGTALMVAARTGDLPVLEYLLAKGADVNQVSNGSSALVEAMLHRQFKLADWFLKHGADPNLKVFEGKSGLHISAEKMPDFFEVLINNGAYFFVDDKGRGVLSYAIQGKNEALVKWLLKMPWPQEQLDDALRKAVREEEAAWVKALLLLNANPDAHAKHEVSALDISRALGNKALEELLIQFRFSN